MLQLAVGFSDYRKPGISGLDQSRGLALRLLNNNERGPSYVELLREGRAGHVAVARAVCARRHGDVVALVGAETGAHRRSGISPRAADDPRQRRRACGDTGLRTSQ